MTSEPDTPDGSDTGNLPPRIMMTVAPRQHGKSAALTSPLWFRAETEGDWIPVDEPLIVSDPPDFSKDDQ